MVFTVWIKEFCKLHQQIQGLVDICNKYGLMNDLFILIKSFLSPRKRTMDIDILEEVSNISNTQIVKVWYDNGYLKYRQLTRIDNDGNIYRQRQKWNRNRQLMYDIKKINNHECGTQLFRNYGGKLKKWVIEAE